MTNRLLSKTQKPFNGRIDFSQNYGDTIGLSISKENKIANLDPMSTLYEN